MAMLAQTYINYRRLELSEDQFIGLGPAMDEAAARVAGVIYGEQVSVDVFLESGSLTSRITIIGALLLGGYHVVRITEDFKGGIVEMTQMPRNSGAPFMARQLSSRG